MAKTLIHMDYPLNRFRLHFVDLSFVSDDTPKNSRARLRNFTQSSRGF